MSWFRVPAAGLLAAGMVAVAGCGADDGTADVSGTVSFEGKPIENGSINFIATDGKGTGGGVIKDGKYAATKVPVGPAKVQISGSKVVGKKKAYNTPDSPMQDITAEMLPKKYNEQTELTFEVKPGKNEKNFELSPK